MLGCGKTFNLLASFLTFFPYHLAINWTPTTINRVASSFVHVLAGFRAGSNRCQSIPPTLKKNGASSTVWMNSEFKTKISTRLLSPLSCGCICICCSFLAKEKKRTISLAAALQARATIVSLCHIAAIYCSMNFFSWGFGCKQKQDLLLKFPFFCTYVHKLCFISPLSVLLFSFFPEISKGQVQYSSR